MTKENGIVNNKDEMHDINGGIHKVKVKKITKYQRIIDRIKEIRRFYMDLEKQQEYDELPYFGEANQASSAANRKIAEKNVYVINCLWKGRNGMEYKSSRTAFSPKRISKTQLVS